MYLGPEPVNVSLDFNSSSSQLIVSWEDSNCQLQQRCVGDRTPKTYNVTYHPSISGNNFSEVPYPNTTIIFDDLSPNTKYVVHVVTVTVCPDVFSDKSAPQTNITGIFNRSFTKYRRTGA